MSVSFMVVSDGIIVRSGYCPEADTAAQAVEEGETVVLGEPQSLGLPAAIALAVDEEWATGVPAGTAVTVDEEEVGTLAGGEPMAFDTPGTYSVAFTPPAPYLAASCRVTVT